LGKINALGSGEIMSDFEIFGLPVYLGTMIYQAILFTALVFVLKRFFLKKIVNVMENRRKAIEEQLELAESYKAEAKMKLVEQQKLLDQAENEAKFLVSKSRKEAAQIVKAAKKEAMLIRSEAYITKDRKERGAS
jgi:F-type H+-transporting ATPase subunit b